MNNKILDEFFEESPEFADINSPERKLGDRIYLVEYSEKVESGLLDYRDALLATRDEVDKRIRFEDIAALRQDHEGNFLGKGMGRVAQFGMEKHAAQRKKDIEAKRGGCSPLGERYRGRITQ